MLLQTEVPTVHPDPAPARVTAEITAPAAAMAVMTIGGMITTAIATVMTGIVIATAMTVITTMTGVVPVLVTGILIVAQALTVLSVCPAVHAESSMVVRRITHPAPPGIAHQAPVTSL